MPSILILGAGDFTGAYQLTMENTEYDERKARATSTRDRHHPRARSLRPGTTVIATEYRSQAVSSHLFKEIDKKLRRADPTLVNKHGVPDHWQSNINCIGMMDGQVVEGFDATQYPPNIGQFDRIIFENPHTGSYGSDRDEVKNMSCVTSNTEFLEGIMNQARVHLKARGHLEIAVCGWPYLSKPSRREKWSEGMDLADRHKADAIARRCGLRWVDTESLGEKKVSRNDGETFRAEVLYLRFRLPSSH